MQIIHPQGPYNGVPPENVFQAVDDIGTLLGLGYIIYQYQEHLCPDRPINMYFAIQGRPSCRVMLFGALVARARQLRDSNRECAARVYTAFKPEDTATRDFYTAMGLKCDEVESVIRLARPSDESRLPMGCSIADTPVNVPEEQAALLRRFAANDVQSLNLGYLAQLRRMPHFKAFGLVHNGRLAGEILAAGAGSSAEIVAFYIAQEYRRQGLGRVMIHRCMDLLAEEGVSEFTVRLLSRSRPQLSMSRAFSGTELAVSTVFANMYL